MAQTASYPAQDVQTEGNFYEILGVAKDVSRSEIKKAYFRLSLLVHPDRNPGHEEEATVKFQALGRIFATLSDSEKRKIYDDTGEVDEGGNPQSFDAWQGFWRNRFPRVTKEDISLFAERFKDSEEERLEILKAYATHRGNMDLILGDVTLATCEDEERIAGIIRAAIEAGEVRPHKRFTQEKTSKKKDAEAAEATALAMELGLSESGPAALIKGRAQVEFEAVTAALAAKYGGGSRSGRSGKKRVKASAAPPDIDDAEFAKIQAKLDARKAARS